MATRIMDPVGTGLWCRNEIRYVKTIVCFRILDFTSIVQKVKQVVGGANYLGNYLCWFLRKFGSGSL